MNHSSVTKIIFMFLAFGYLFFCTKNSSAEELESSSKNDFVSRDLHDDCPEDRSVAHGGTAPPLIRVISPDPKIPAARDVGFPL